MDVNFLFYNINNAGEMYINEMYVYSYSTYFYYLFEIKFVVKLKNIKLQLHFFIIKVEGERWRDLQITN